MRGKPTWMTIFYRQLIWLGLALLISNTAFATKYYTRQSGSWTSNTSWSNTPGGNATQAPSTIGSNDTVYVLHAMTNAVNITVGGYLFIDSSASITFVTGTGSSTLAASSGALIQIEGDVIMHKTGSGNQVWRNILTANGTINIKGTLTMSG
ncbi:MAG: hypothetical protein LPK45_11095, partial [Bacteroidota bacterium]|nr:hypothetical protein [Bacteroidota bacterium]MDX5431648.1 hypothetical protein [Bacteroidota bacterium]MDX5470366.1 hypothetical protein [Bacteroidota bacterium]